MNTGQHELPSLAERVRIYEEGSNEWEYFLTSQQVAYLPPSAHAFWKPLDWVNYIGNNWRRINTKAMSAKARAALKEST